MNQSLGKLIQDAIKDGSLRSDVTPLGLKKFFNENAIVEEVIDEEPEEITIDEHELLIEVVGASKYNVEVKQDDEVIKDPEGDGYAVSTGSNIDIEVTSGKKRLVYSYQVSSNRDIIFDLKNKEVVDRDDRV